MDSSSSIFFLLASVLFLLVMKLLFTLWVLPFLAYKKLESNGFSGPTPSFPMGNLNDMKKLKTKLGVLKNQFSNDIHSVAFPYFFQWQKLHGKVFLYWLGTEPFVYIADPEFLRQMSEDIKAKDWGKPNVFKDDRDAMFGKGLVMVEGEDWVRHRHIIAPAFSPANLKTMGRMMVESGTKMVERWTVEINSGRPEIDVEAEIIRTAGEIIAKTSFGISFEKGEKVLEKLRELQITLFKSSRYIGVPFGKFFNPKLNLKATSLGREIDAFLNRVIEDRMKDEESPEKDLLGLLMAANGGKRGRLTKKELVDECKTFFFGGHETTGLALTWTLLLLGRHPEWQEELREEMREVMGEGEGIDTTMVARLKKMGWVLNEVLRLYPSAPNVQRQARRDIGVGNVVIPNGTNIWVDIVSMHHDTTLWGDHVHEFKPERFNHDNGGCKHRLGFMPFGLGGRMCVGRNLTVMEYKIVLSLILSRFSFSISPSYRHCPGIMLSLRPMYGLPLIFRHL